MSDEEAVLVLEDGRAFTGRPFGATGATVGEIVFNTGMTGYQETLTDPSYHRQIVVMTAPHIGNTGVNEEDPESTRIWVAGFVVRDPAIRPSSWRSTRALTEALESEGVVGISDIDTRALTRHLRERGVMRAGIFSGDALRDSSGRRLAEQDLLDVVTAAPVMTGADLAREVTVAEPYTVQHLRGPASPAEPVATVVAVDLGIKSMTPQRLAERGVRTHVVPATTSVEELLALRPDGVFFSNGPGDPAAAVHEVSLLRAVLRERIPFFGICYGNQLLGRALGFGTYKLAYGHRGVNQPVMDRRTRKVEITAHNHGFAVDAPTDADAVAPFEDGRFGRVRVSHVALNDGVVEGLECLDLPAFSVQYHPEAAAGPHDADYLFDRFVQLMTAHRSGGGTTEESPADAPSH